MHAWSAYGLLHMTTLFTWWGYVIKALFVIASLCYATNNEWQVITGARCRDTLLLVAFSSWINDLVCIVNNISNMSNEYLLLVVNFNTLAQASDVRIKRRQVVFPCWMQDSNPGSQAPNIFIVTRVLVQSNLDKCGELLFCKQLTVWGLIVSSHTL